MPKIVNIDNGEQVALFNTIAIEIASKCNRTCHFCPNSYHKREDVFMEQDTVFHFIQQLKELKYKGRIEWYIYNEPTRDSRLSFFIEYTRVNLPSCCQMINTNGDFFKSAADIDALFAAGLNQMQINIDSSSDDSDDNFVFDNGVRLAKKREAVLQGYLDALPYIDQSQSLYLNIGPRKKAAKVVPKYGITKQIKDSDVDGPNHFSNRSGNVPGFRPAARLDKHCVRPFRFLNINYNGDAILCCNDFYGETNFGNVKTNTLLEIWNHPALNLYRLKLQNKKRDCFLCHNCDYKGGYYPHMCDTVTMGQAVDEFHLIKDYSEKKSIWNIK